MTSKVKPFGPRLKWWREHRGLSQLAVSGAAATSQRHLSFLESGRAEPSREMVLRLSAVLDVPLRQQNALLLAAGFAPVWRESDLTDPELAQVNGALDFMLAQQEPFPAFVVDRRWNLLRANGGAGRLVTFLLEAAPAGAVNLADALVAPDVLRPLIENWEEVAVHFLRSVQADAVADGTAETAELLKRLTAYPGVPPLSRVAPLETHTPVLHIHFRKGATRFSVFTTIATLGTPQDVTLQEIRIECFFPSDAGSAELLRSWARDS
jgi:transcriptional regulator with XRE-family HTH domain